MKAVKRIAVLTCLLSLFIAGVYAAQNESGYYLVYEEFALPQPNTYSSNIPSSWDVDAVSAGLGYSGGCSLGDSSDILTSVMQREFNAESGQVRWEFTFNTAADMYDSCMEMRSGDKRAVSLVVTEKGLVARTKSTEVVAVDANSLGKVVGVRADIDVPSNTYELWINGKKVGSKLTFPDECTQVDKVYIETGREAVGNIVIGTVRVSTGLYVDEKFVSSPYNITDEWTIEGNTSDFAVERKAGDLNQDKYSLKIADGDFMGQSRMSRGVDYAAEEAWLEYQFLIPESMDAFDMVLTGGGRELIRVGNRKNQFGYVLPDGSFEPVYNMISNQWYHVMLKVTKEGGKLYINHKLKADNIPLSFLKFDNMAFESGKAATGTIYLDDILLKDYYPYPEDYVPAPEVPEHGDYIVGMQSCNMWRDGTHFGWDWLNPWDDRKSYMGFYDEGSPEVKDWEIKWMLEHGIDYELYCWFRPPGGDDQPIKYPRNGYALQEGFMNARYSDQAKFAIAWENGGSSCSGSKDFRENVVTYWLEQYFKDPRYLVVDNKPVVSIYNFSKIVSFFGSVDGVRAELDYLRQACQKEGFDGCIILLSNNTSDPAQLQQFKDAGFDCIYSYSWGNSCYLIENQMSAMENQRKTGIMDMMATLDMGRDDTPWERSAGGFCTLEDFERLLNWARDEFIPSLPSGSLGKKFIMFDNWNEYGEGHFMAPTTLHGFGYIDLVRDIFTKGPQEHEDVSPTEAQKERINHLYVQDRAMTKSFAARNTKKEDDEVPANVKLGYYFDEGTDGWTVAKQVDEFKAENGVISGVSNNTDPGVYSPDNIGMSLGDVTHVRIRMKTDVPAPSITLYYITEADTGWAESKSLKGTYQQIAGETYELILPVGSQQGWKGKLKQLRLDPMTELGYFEIDSVEFLNKEMKDTVRLLVDGEEVFSTRPIKLQNDVTMYPAAEIGNIFNGSFNHSLDRTAAELFCNETVYFSLPYGEKTGTKNEESIKLAEPACIIDEEAYFPLRSIAEALGYQVSWDETENAVSIVTDPEAAGGVPAGPSVPDPEGTFNFNTAADTQGWAVGANLSSAKVKGGVFSMRSTGSDPTLNLKSVNWDAAKYPKAYLRVKNESKGTKFQIYFTTDTSPSLKESQSVSVAMQAQSKDFQIYELNMAANSAWKGKITQLRMDPTDNQGLIEIDYLIFTDQEMELGGDEGSAGGINILPGGTMQDQSFRYSTDGVKAFFSAENAYIGRYFLQAEKEREDGALLIPADMKQDKNYSYSMWVRLPAAGSVAVGTIAPDGSRKEAGTAEIRTPGIWTKVAGSFSLGEASEEPALYITSDTDAFAVDGVAIRQPK